MGFEKSTLWQRTLGERPNDPDSDARARLRVAFLSARSAVSPLVAQIGAQLPALTVHDISHLDALWDVADVLLGPDYPMTPPEAFVLGMAFLLHDAATSTAGFAGGLDEIKATVEWTDVAAQNGWKLLDLAPGTPQYQSALFEVLRILHPKQAEKLLSISWRLPGGAERFVIEDVQLRNYYGHVIGRIAHSHWWEVATVEDAWAHANPLALHSSMTVSDPMEWRVDAFKVALILRCCDAAHIDARRAPDMLAALVRPEGVSALHWLFQNRLGLPSLSNSGEVYWSAGQPFASGDAEAWWLCFDTARMVDRELRASNQLLEGNGRQTFRALGVAGAQYVPEFVKNVPVEGWYPVDVNFKVTRVGDVIEKFGGARLYGAEPWRALKELLQNAADAVRARRAKRKTNNGRIQVHLFEKNNAWWLEVLDDGVGMSRYVLTEVLLDFGRSLWTDRAVRQEFPGLLSSGFKSVGQFGIGFMSIFMLGDQISVTSWRDGDAEEKQATLSLPHRTRGRPVLVRPSDEERLQSFGTRVRVRLRDGLTSLLPTFETWGSKGVKKFWTIHELVGALVPTIDIDVFAGTNGTLTQTVRAGDWTTLTSPEMLTRIGPRAGSSTSTALHNVEEIGGSLVGRLGHGTSAYGNGLGNAQAVITHQGIRVGTLNGIVGVLLGENNVDLAREHATPIASAAALQQWARLSKRINLRTEWLFRSETRRLLSLGLPSNEIELSDKKPELLSAAAVRQWVEDFGHEEILLLRGSVDTPDEYSQKEFTQYFTLLDNVVEVSSDIERRENFGLGEWIARLVPEDESNPRTTLGVLLKYILEAFPDAEVSEGSSVVGHIHDDEVYARCISVSNLQQ